MKRTPPTGGVLSSSGRIFILAAKRTPGTVFVMTLNPKVALFAFLSGALSLTACATTSNSSANPGPQIAATSPAAPASTTPSSMPSTSPENTTLMEYQIGDTGPGGGIVFLVSVEPFPCGVDLLQECNYLEAAPGSSEVRRGWADVPRLEMEVDGADATGIGTGWTNTSDIIKQGNTDPVTSAAAYADSYEYSGKDDWYLPSRDEFKALYEQRDVVGEFSGADYWSSSEVSPKMAWSHYFHQGHPLLPHPKNHYTHLIRPIRAF